MFKFKLSKEEFEKLSEEMQKAYKQDGEEFVLEIEGLEDTGALKRAKDREKQRANDLEEKVNELEEKLDGITNEDARKKGDIETLEKSWQGKLDDQKTGFEATIDGLKGFALDTLKNSTAKALAVKISTVPDLMIDAIQKRLTVDFEGEKPTLRILDAEGNISASTVEDLEKDFLQNEKFASILVGSKASGSGASNADRTASGAIKTGDGEKTLAQLSPKELSEQIKPIER